MLLLILLIHGIITQATKIALSIDSGEIHIDSNHPIFLDHINNQHTFRGYKLQYDTTFSILCGTPSLDPHDQDNVPNNNWCTTYGIVIWQEPAIFCICLHPIDTSTTTTTTSVPSNLIGQIDLKHQITTDSIQSIISHQTQIIEAWSLDQHGKHPPIDRIPCCVSSDELWNRWFKKGLPVIITGMVSKWKAMHWTTSMFREKYGNVSIYTRNPHDPKASIPENMKIQTTVGQYMNFLDNTTLSSQQHQHHMVGMLNTFHDKVFRPLVQKEILYEEAYFDALPIDIHSHWNAGMTPLPWMGPRGTHTPLHHDVRSSFNCQLIGTKRWQLIHGRQQKLLYLMKSMRNYALVNQDERRLDQVNVIKYPLFERATVWNITNQPGEALLLPAGLFHDVVCEDQICMTISLYNFRRDMLIKEHRWMSETMAIGLTVSLSKHLRMGTGTNRNSRQPTSKSVICPTTKQIQELTKRDKNNVDVKFKIECKQAIWTLVNVAPYKVKIITIQGDHVADLEGNTAMDVPLMYSESEFLIAKLEHGTTVGILFKRTACFESIQVAIVRSLILPCKMSSEAVANRIVIKAFNNIDLKMMKFKPSGLECSTVGVWIPMQYYLGIHPVHFIKATHGIGVNVFHINIQDLVETGSVLSMDSVLGDVVGDDSGIRDEIVLVCHLGSILSKKRAVTVLNKGLRIMGTTCDVLVLQEGELIGDDFNVQNIEWYLEKGLTLYVGTVKDDEGVKVMNVEGGRLVADGSGVLVGYHIK